ncbi:signal peptidase I [Chloroflexota bacterium]
MRSLEALPENTLPPPPDTSLDEPVALPRPRLQKRRIVREIIETALLFIIIFTLVNLLTGRFVVDGSSMAPNFATGQFLIASRISYLLGEPQRGDVVVFHSPEDGGKDLIKRIIGLPGDTIEVSGGQVTVNGIVLDEPYINAQPRYSDQLTLNAGEYYVLGDNRNNSRDSHSFGSVPAQNLIGQAWVIYWPPQNWGLVPHYEHDVAPSMGS